MLEDLEASVEVTLFPRTLQEHGHKLADDVVVAVKGRLDRRDESRVDADLPDRRGARRGSSRARRRRSRLRIPATVARRADASQRLKRILRDHPGDSVVSSTSARQVLRLSDEFRVDVDRAVGELRMAFGHDAVSL